MKRIRCEFCNTRIRGRGKVKIHIRDHWVCKALKALREARDLAYERAKLILG